MLVYFPLYLLGCIPNCFLNNELKYFVLTNPVSAATSVTLLPSFSSSAAFCSRMIRIKSSEERSVNANGMIVKEIPQILVELDPSYNITKDLRL